MLWLLKQKQNKKQNKIMKQKTKTKQTNNEQTNKNIFLQESACYLTYIWVH